MCRWERGYGKIEKCRSNYEGMLCPNLDHYDKLAAKQ
jgi:hypothetical protein